jgi:hypothetical protein
MCAVAFGATATGEDKKPNKLPEPVLKALEKGDELELYSLDGSTTEKDGWHGAKVLGKTTVKGEDAKKFTTALKKGVEEGDKGARCFIPRHGVRAIFEGKTYDLVICFECHWVYIYIDKGDKPDVYMTSESFQKQFNTILTGAKVPLAKPEK